MRVATILPSLKSVASVRVAVNIADYLADVGVDSQIFFFDAHDHTRGPKNYFCPKVPANRITSGDYRKVFDFDILHSHGYRPDSFVSEALLAKNKQKQIGLTTLHNYINLDLQSTYNSAISHVFTYLWFRKLQNLDCVVSLSKDAMIHHMRWVNPSKSAFVHNGLDPDFTGEVDSHLKRYIQTLKERGSIVLGVVSRFLPAKGLDQVLRVLTYDKRLVCIFVGAGKEENKLRRLSKQLQVDNQCHFAGFKPNGNLYFKLFDVGLFPSRFEGFPLALLECVAAGTPCVSSNISCLTEFFSDEDVAFFELDNIEHFYFQIKRVLASPCSFASNAEKKRKTTYTVKNMGTNYLTLYERLLENRIRKSMVFRPK